MGAAKKIPEQERVTRMDVPRGHTWRSTLLPPPPSWLEDVHAPLAPPLPDEDDSAVRRIPRDRLREEEPRLDVVMEMNFDDVAPEDAFERHVDESHERPTVPRDPDPDRATLPSPRWGGESR